MTRNRPLNCLKQIISTAYRDFCWRKDLWATYAFGLRVRVAVSTQTLPFPDVEAAV
jgi:hypothetical protein